MKADIVDSLSYPCDGKPYYQKRLNLNIPFLTKFNLSQTADYSHCNDNKKHDLHYVFKNKEQTVC